MKTETTAAILALRAIEVAEPDAAAPEEIALRLKTLMLLSALSLGAIAAPLAAAEQQESYTFTLGLLAGIGGSLDAEPDPGLTQSSWAIAAGMITAPRTLVVVRAGRLVDRRRSGRTSASRAPTSSTSPSPASTVSPSRPTTSAPTSASAPTR